MSISSVTAAAAIRNVAATASPSLPVQPVEAPAHLAPAVRVDIRANEAGRPDPDAAKSDATRSDADAAAQAKTEEQHLTIDPDTKTLVFKVVDQGTGDVVVQIPDAVVLKSRAYADALAARAQKVDHPVDRTA